MAYKIISPALAGHQPIADTSTVQNHPIGYEVQAYDVTYGVGKFIYLKGATNTVVGSMVTWAADTGATELSPDTAKSGRPIAVSMSANAATGYGWYQVSGSAVIKKTAVKVDPAVANRVFQSATIGRAMQTSASSKQILGARWSSLTTITSTTSTAVATISYPHVQGNIT
jgi:hypothetical protein